MTRWLGTALKDQPDGHLRRPRSRRHRRRRELFAANMGLSFLAEIRGRQPRGTWLRHARGARRQVLMAGQGRRRRGAAAMPCHR